MLIHTVCYLALTLKHMAIIKESHKDYLKKNHLEINTIYIFYVYGSVHHNIFYETTNRCSYMQSILFHC